MALESRKYRHSTQNREFYQTVSLVFFENNRPSHFVFILPLYCFGIPNTVFTLLIIHNDYHNDSWQCSWHLQYVIQQISIIRFISEVYKYRDGEKITVPFVFDENEKG